MLVLLIMFIIIIPVASHKVPLDLPPGPRSSPARRRRSTGSTSPPAARSPGTARALAAAALPARLRAMAADPARPVLHLNADGEARYERVDQHPRPDRRAGVTRLGFVDNRRFGRAF